MIELYNPFNEAKAELVRKYNGDIPVDKQEEYDLLDGKSRELVKKKIAEADSFVNKLHEDAKAVKKVYPAITNQYKELVRLHREAKEIAKDIGLMKKNIIDEINQKRKKE